MPTSTEFITQYIPKRQVFYYGDPMVASPPPIVHPMTAEEIEEFEEEQVETSNVAENLLKTSKEKPLTLSQILMFGLVITLIIITILTLALILTISLHITVSCNPQCLNNGRCVGMNSCLCDTTAWTGSYCQTPVQIYWSFDGTVQDFYNNFNGDNSFGHSFSFPGYSGNGACLWLTRSLNQSLTITSPPFLNMAYTSFTLEVWIMTQTLCTGSPCTDNAIFGQSNQNTTDNTLYISIRNQRIYFGFTFDDVLGSQIVNTGQWYHIACVYNNSTRTQSIYVNGDLDVSRSSAGPYQGSSGSFTMGSNIVNAPNNFFDGCLDAISYVSRAKNATEILNDATTVSYLSFDGYNLLDSGPLSISGTGSYYGYTSSGRVNQGLSLSASLSYVQITGLVRIGTVGWPYTVSIWIRPTNAIGGTIMHLSSRTDGAQTNAWCLPIMGFTSSGQIAINSWNNVNVPLNGPAIPLLAWTHIAGTYSATNGERLYVNGTQYGSASGAYTFAAASANMTITLGSSLLGTGACNTGTIQMGQYSGSLDEFQVYSRELTAAQIYALANP